MILKALNRRFDDQMKTRLEQLFHEVADLPYGARSRYYAERAVDADMRGNVKALLEPIQQSKTCQQHAVAA